MKFTIAELIYKSLRLCFLYLKTLNFQTNTYREVSHSGLIYISLRERNLESSMKELLTMS